MRAQRFVLVVAVSLLVVVAAGLGVGAPPDRAEGVFPGANGKIAFSVSDFYTSPVSVIDPAGGGPVQLTTGADYGPTWSPDGTKIAFTRQEDFSCDVTCDFEIFVMNADGSSQTPLTDHPAWDTGSAWSPDGTKIAFASNRVGLQFDIYSIDVDGTGLTNLTNNPASDSGAGWSPDGSKIAFRRTVGPESDIMLMNADGTGQVNLTPDTAFDVAQAWSPDGTKLAFLSTRDGDYDIYAMNADGSAPTNLTNDLANDGSPAWSPDGTKIAFTTDRDEPNPSTCGLVCNREVYVMNANGSGPTNLTDSPSEEDVGAVWSPDGTQLAFTSLLVRGGHYSSFEMSTVRADGSSSPSPLFAGSATDCCGQDWQAVAGVGGIARLADVPRADGAKASGAGTRVAVAGAALIAATVLLSSGTWLARRQHP